METEDEPYRKKILSKLTGAVLEEFVRSKPSKPLPSQYKNYITQRLHGFFPILRTPSHPTYAAMINTAISELEDDGGSTEEAISEFIKQKFEDLPWAHASLLSHHLKKLSQRGELIRVSEKHYMLPNENTDSVVENGDQSREGQIVVEENKSLKQDAIVRNKNGVQGCQMKIDDQNQSQEQLIKQTGEGRQEECQVGFSNEQCLVGEKQTEFKEKQNEAQSFQNEDETMEDQQVEVKTQEEVQNVARRHELEEIGGKSLLQDQQMEEQNQAVFREPIKSGEIYEDEECNQAEEPQVEWICDLKQAEGQSEAIEEQSQAQRQLTKVNEEIAQQSEEVVNALSLRKIEAFEDQIPVEQKLEVSEEEKEASGQALTGYGNAEHAEKQQDEVIKEPKHRQQIQAAQKHSEVGEGQSKMINEQTQEQHNEAIKDQSQSSEQQNQQQDERYVGRIPTQLEEIAVAAVKKSKAEGKNEATEELEQGHRRKEPQNEMPQGKTQIGDIDRREQLLEEQIELIDKLTQLQRRKNEAIDERNKPLQEINSQIDPSIVQELLKKQQRETDATALDPYAIMVSGGDGLLPRKKRCIELLDRTKKIEGELLEILNFLSVSEVSNHSNLESTVELEERQLQIEIPCRDVEYIVGSFQLQKLQQPQICGQNNAFNSQLKRDEYTTMGVFSSSVEQNDSMKQKPQHKDKQRILRSRMKPEAALSASQPLQNETLNLEKQWQPKKRGRPPKPKPVTATTIEALTSFEHQMQQEQPQKKRRGRPPKPKLDGDIDLTEQAGAKRRPCNQKLDEDTTTRHNLLSWKPVESTNFGTTTGDNMIWQNQQKQPNLDADTATGHNLIPQYQQLNLDADTTT